MPQLDFSLMAGERIMLPAPNGALVDGMASVTHPLRHSMGQAWWAELGAVVRTLGHTEQM